MSPRDPRNFIFQAGMMTLFQKFYFEVQNKYDIGRVIVKGFINKSKVSGASFRMHMRNRRFSKAKPKVHEYP
jgi:hypothetical protein